MFRSVPPNEQIGGADVARMSYGPGENYGVDLMESFFDRDTPVGAPLASWRYAVESHPDTKAFRFAKQLGDQTGLVTIYLGNGKNSEPRFSTAVTEAGPHGVRLLSAAKRVPIKDREAFAERIAEQLTQLEKPEWDLIAKSHSKSWQNRFLSSFQ